MKITYTALSLLICLTVSTECIAQEPVKFYGIAKDAKPLTFYEDQSIAWEKHINAHPDDAEAWVYYYKANRAIEQLKAGNNWVNDKETFYAKLDPILRKAQKSIGDCFEYYYISGLNSAGQESITKLEKAYALDPDRVETHGWLFSYYAPLFNEKKSLALAKSMIENNLYSNANLKWNYNALASVEPNGIFLSVGDMDCIPKWVLQYGADVRTDVLVISKWLLAEDEAYRVRILKKLNWQSPLEKRSAFKNITEYADYLMAEIIRKSKRPAYITAGTPMAYFEKNNLEDQVYLVGNALKYSATPFDNTAVMIENYEQHYFVEYLLNNYQHHLEDEVVQSQMNLTYLPSLIHLKNHYCSKQEQNKQAYYKKIFDQIVADSGNAEEVSSWFK